MLVILGLCSKDVEHGINLLSWIAELGEVKNHELFLIFDGSVSWPQAREAVTVANESFRVVDTRATDRVDGWIPGSNTLFKTAAMWAQEVGRPFLWMEADAIPLRPSWLNDLDAAYQTCGRPFMGAFLKASHAKFPNPFMEGVAIYPANTWTLFQSCWDDQKMINPSASTDLLQSWVVTCSPVAVRNGVHTPLIQQVWGQHEGMAVDFVAVRTIHSQPQDWTLAQLHPEAVLFHRTKTDSLIRLLRGVLFADRPDYSNPPAFVQMGRFGDLILLLPAFQAWAQRSGTRIPVITSKEFGTVLEGASYVQPVMMPKLTWYDAGQARNWAQARYKKVIVTQLHGSDIPTIPDDLPSYSYSMWSRTGLLEEYLNLMPVFDQRIPSREKALIQSYTQPGKPIILYKFDGWTSPFDGGPALRKRLEYWNDVFQFVDIGAIHAYRIFDLLGLYDIATGLITSDTFTLHLAPATDLPYIAYVRDDGQSGSIPKGNCVLKVGYSQWDKQMDAFDLQLELWRKHPKAI